MSFEPCIININNITHVILLINFYAGYSDYYNTAPIYNCGSDMDLRNRDWLAY